MPRERLLHLIDDRLLLLGQDRDYVAGIVRQMNSEGKLRGNELQLHELTEDQIQTKVIAALKKACSRQWPSKDHLFGEFQDWL